MPRRLSSAARQTAADGAILGAAGWWTLARRCPSPNVGMRPAGVAPTLAIVHSISLPPGHFGGPEVEALFTNTLDASGEAWFEAIRGLRVSAHFFIRRDGECVQFAGCADRAWHAGVSSWRGRENCNDYSIGIELEGLEGERFEAAQYRCLGQLLRALARSYPIRHVAGHEHVAPGRKGDPGPGFDWLRLQRLLRWPDRCFPA